MLTCKLLSQLKREKRIIRADAGPCGSCKKRSAQTSKTCSMEALEHAVKPGKGTVLCNFACLDCAI